MNDKQRQAHFILKLFEQRQLEGLIPVQVYCAVAEELFFHLQQMAPISLDRLQTAVISFNTQFSKIRLPQVTTQAKRIPSRHSRLRGDDRSGEELLTFHESPLIAALTAEIDQGLAVYDQNCYVLVKQVCYRMHQGAQAKKLHYHQANHGLEVLHDVSILMDLMRKQDARYQHFSLLMILCGLFHDVVYNKKRVDDEQDSIENLISALQPIFVRMPADDTALVRHFIFIIIIGGTLPCFFKSSRGDKKQKNPIMDSLFETIYPLDEKHEPDNPTLRFIAQLANVIGDADVLRCSIPALHPRANKKRVLEYRVAVSKSLPPVQRALLREQLAQDLRMLFEVHPQLFAKLARGGSLADLNALVQGLQNSVSFAQKMNNKLRLKKLAKWPYAYDNLWQLHQEQLRHWIGLLGDHFVSLQARLEQAKKLLLISTEQDGADFTVEDIRRCFSFAATTTY